MRSVRDVTLVTITLSAALSSLFLIIPQETLCNNPQASGSVGVGVGRAHLLAGMLLLSSAARKP